MENSRRTPLVVDAAFYTACAAFAGYTALWSALPAHRFWGAIAVGGYLPAALIALMLLTRYALPVMSRLWLAAGATFAVTVMPLLALVAQRASGVPQRAQEEVLVVENSGVRLWETGSPYAPADTIADSADPLLLYNPYQPGMSLFGLPRALLGDGWFGDARIWFALATLALCWPALLLLRRLGVTLLWRVRAVQAIGVLPICALTLATGGDDLPVLAACLLALSAVAAGRHVPAGVAIGVAAALKLFAWPVAAVLLILTIRRGGWRGFTPFALGIPALSMLPALLWHRSAFVDNVIDFPLGHGVVTSPAASPLPGYLIAQWLPAGSIIATVALVLAAALIGGYLLWRPPRDAAQAAACCALGLTAAIALMPASRFGYLLYPAVLGVWWWVLRHGRDQHTDWDVGPEVVAKPVIR